MYRFIGKTERRVVAALLATAILPLIAALWWANGVINNVTRTAFHQEYLDQLDRSLGVYKDLVASMKRAMRNEGAAIGERHELRVAAQEGDRAALGRELERAMRAHPTLVSIEIHDPEGEKVAGQKRPTPIDESRERPFQVDIPLAEGDSAPTMQAVFAADRARIDELESAVEFAQAYKSFAGKHLGEWLSRPHLLGFGALLGCTLLLAVITGIFVVRPLTRRIDRLAAATRPVAEGDLTVRVADSGRDEIGDLARSFNQMLEQLEKSRARIEFLKRIGEWQQMARRLAHEIKNPLTPIQLAVEECHRRYQGDDASYKKLLSTTLDIVVEEVQSLRRLVGEFAEFARLPRADLRKGDMREFLQEQKPRLLRDEVAGAENGGVALDIDVPDEEIPIALDRTMLYRVLSNLVQNAAQANAGSGRVRVHAERELEACVLDVEDDGPGVPQDLRQSVFDPYVTTKKDGTGLGLTIVKKVIIDHGGHVDVDESPLGGARFRIRLPLWGTSASEVAMTRSERHPLSG
ncbi:MAG TPA: ATP-binding protein [Polyangiaceae bacterium]|nr:ATP-binding protein [Polyangiaceae bacterium]